LLGFWSEQIQQEGEEGDGQELQHKVVAEQEEEEDDKQEENERHELDLPRHFM
jgi:hypothetical protein